LPNITIILRRNISFKINEQMSTQRFEPGAFMTERERSTN
jgi:hypothetical protein